MSVKLRGFLSNGFVSRVLQILTLSNRQIKLLRFSTMLHFREVIFSSPEPKAHKVSL